MHEAQYKEQRKADRKKITGRMPVTDINRERVIGQLVDISIDGLMLLGGAPLAINGMYQFDIELPEPVNGHSVLHLGAECLWCRTAEDPEHFWAGFHLIDISPEDQSTLDALISLL